ncbi:MAG: septal ring lytic transglycosylase RlpA family protein [Novosphingobium sp.]
MALRSLIPAFTLAGTLLLPLSASAPALAEATANEGILAEAVELPATLALPAPAALAEPAPPAQAAGDDLGSGMASYYGSELAGRRTASGERFDPGLLTAAHRTLPFGSMVRVTNTRTGKSVVVRINDRGPFTRGRVIDVSRAAASQIGLIGPGHGEVSLTLLDG